MEVRKYILDSRTSLSAARPEQRVYTATLCFSQSTVVVDNVKTVVEHLINKSYKIRLTHVVSLTVPKFEVNKKVDWIYYFDNCHYSYLGPIDTLEGSCFVTVDITLPYDTSCNMVGKDILGVIEGYLHNEDRARLKCRGGSQIVSNGVHFSFQPQPHRHEESTGLSRLHWCERRVRTIPLKYLSYLSPLYIMYFVAIGASWSFASVDWPVSMQFTVQEKVFIRLFLLDPTIIRSYLF